MKAIELNAQANELKSGLKNIIGSTLVLLYPFHFSQVYLLSHRTVLNIKSVEVAHSNYGIHLCVSIFFWPVFVLTLFLTLTYHAIIRFLCSPLSHSRCIDDIIIFGPRPSRLEWDRHGLMFFTRFHFGDEMEPIDYDVSVQCAASFFNRNTSNQIVILFPSSFFSIYF